MRAAALLRIARVQAAIDRAQARKTFEQALDEIRRIPGRDGAFVLGQARLFAAAIAPDLLAAIPAEHHTPRHLDGLGVSASMVRSWEKLGLTSPARSHAKYRLYSDDDLRVLQRAIYLRRVQGLNFPAILQLLRLGGLLNRPVDGHPADRGPIGPIFRKLRLQLGETLATVAEAVGVKKGFLSNIERSQNSASIGAMRKLAQHYGLHTEDLFISFDGTGSLVRPPDRKKLKGGPDVQMELLASGKITMKPHLFRIAPRGRQWRLLFARW